MSRKLRDIYAQAFALLTLTVGCAPNLCLARDEFDLLKSKDAVDVEEHQLKPDVVQLNYRVSLAYPSLAISDAQFNNLSSRGWKKCSTSQADWESYENFVDASNPICVHRLRKYFVKDNDNLFFSARYESKLVSGGFCPSAPDNDRQTIIVVIYENASENGCK